MNTKRLITASIFSLISASTALAADVMIPHQPASSTSSSAAIVAPTFSWTGLYLGVHAGGFSSKADMALVGQEKSLPLDKEFSPKLSGFAGGFYAGSNIDLGDNFIFGVDTDLTLSGKKHTKSITIGAPDNATVENVVLRSRRSTKVTQPTVSAVGTPTTTQIVSSEHSASEKSVKVKSASSAVSAKVGEVISTAKETLVGTKESGALTSAAPAERVITSQSASSSVGESSGKLVRTPLPRSGAESLVSELKSVALKPTSSTTGVSSPKQTTLLLARSDAGEQSSSAVSNVPNTPAKLSSTQTVKETSGPSTLSTRLETSQSIPVKPTLGQSSLAEKTVPSSPLVLGRSGSSSGSEAKASNGTSGAHGGHHGHGYAHPYSISHAHGTNPHSSGAHAHGNSHGSPQSPQAADKNDSSVYGIEQMKRMASELGFDQEDEVETLSHTFKQNWGGATRVRIGFAADRFMPYLAGGIAYGQFQDTVSVSVKDEDGSVVSSKNLTDETKTMIGYTLGGGVDFAVLDNVIVRAEYRYSDFGKKKFAKEKLEVNYKTNDFRVGVAYKF
ncbi:outer membrane beta-barrel protein [Bartonella queenslandensis]|uniref:outer membrane beta-barrel protein n=1 Tax=Bartonella queenslandensis TaxID=481138 RepID=UPI001BA80E76|nr:outer membrane beta-barrel protein [Bartonella queenslandensis]